MEKDAKQVRNPLMQSLSDAMGTHPPSEEKVKQMDEMVMDAPAAKNSIISSPDFNRFKQVAAYNGELMLSSYKQYSQTIFRLQEEQCIRKYR